jgi:hypothetical protein
LLIFGSLLEDVLTAWDSVDYWYNLLPELTHFWSNGPMSDELNKERVADGVADATAVVAILVIAVLAMYLWLSGMPT